MIEINCSTCGKVCGYLVKGSKIANGTIHLCYKCKRPKTDISEFLKGFRR